MRIISYLDNDYLLDCINTLHKSFIKAHKDLDLDKFYKSKIDVIKLSFDKEFNNINDEDLINNEIKRQIDKSINNAIGTFHEDILSGVDGYSKGEVEIDFKSNDDKLFAEIKNKWNTMNSRASNAVFDTLKKYADSYDDSKCFWVAINTKSSYEEEWIYNDKKHERVFKISGDLFYEKVTGKKDALFELYSKIPQIVKKYFGNKPILKMKSSALDEINKRRKINSKNIVNQIAKDNYPYFDGFNNL